MDSSSFLLAAIGPDEAGLRLDLALASALRSGVGERRETSLSRSRLTRMIRRGRVMFADAGQCIRDPARTVRSGERYRIHMQPAEDIALGPQPLPLAILYEDPHLLIVNKAPGMLVHPARRSHDSTLAHALLAHCGSALATVGHPQRPGIVHRLDVGTGGLLVVAKQEPVRLALARRFAAHHVDREYLGICQGRPSRSNPDMANCPGLSFHPDGWVRLESRIGADPRRPTRRAVVGRGGKRAITHLQILAGPAPPAPQSASLLRCHLETGRTHQIRVHLAWVGHPLVGDSSYGHPRFEGGRSGRSQAAGILAAFPRPALHAYRLGFEHPATGRPMQFAAPPHEDFRKLAESLDIKIPAPSELEAMAPSAAMLRGWNSSGEALE